MGQNYKVGDFIIDFACIYTLTLIEPGKKGNLIHCKPIKGTDKIFEDIIPEENLNKNGLRRLLNLKEIDVILEEFKKPIESCCTFDLRQIKEDLYANIPERLIYNLKCFYHQEEPLIKAEEDLKETILNHFCLEISFVTNKATLSIKKMIESSLLGK